MLLVLLAACGAGEGVVVVDPAGVPGGVRAAPYAVVTSVAEGVPSYEELAGNWHAWAPLLEEHPEWWNYYSTAVGGGARIVLAEAPIDCDDLDERGVGSGGAGLTVDVHWVAWDGPVGMAGRYVSGGYVIEGDGAVARVADLGGWDEEGVVQFDYGVGFVEVDALDARGMSGRVWGDVFDGPFTAARCEGEEG